MATKQAQLRFAIKISDCKSSILLSEILLKMNPAKESLARDDETLNLLSLFPKLNQNIQIIIFLYKICATFQL